MDALSTLYRMFVYDSWANRRVLHALDSADAGRAEGLRLLGQVLRTERAALHALRGRSGAGGEPPTAADTPAECERLEAEVREGFARMIGEMGEDDLERWIPHGPSPDGGGTTAADLLVHVALHAAHHRGLIAAAVHAAGGEPVDTGYDAFAAEDG